MELNMALLKNLSSKSKDNYKGNKPKEPDVKDTESATVYTAVDLNDSANEADVVDKNALHVPSKLCFMLSIIAMALSIVPGFTLSGFLLGVFTLLFARYLNKQSIEVATIKGVRYIAVVAIALGLIMTSAYSGAFASQNNEDTVLDQNVSLVQTGVDDVQKSEAVSQEEPCLSLEIGNIKGVPVSSLRVTVVGKTNDGLEVNDVRTIPVGIAKKTDYPAGSYTFSFDEFLSTDGKQVYKPGSSLYVFDGKESKTVKIPLMQDVEKTAEITAAEEAAKAAAEAEAAAAVQAEAEAKAQAEATAKAQAAAKQSQSSSGGGTVYVASSGNGKKYHSNPNCSNMSGTREMSVSQAKAAGYTACKKCY